MPERDWRVRVEDILEAIDRINRYTEGMSEARFRENEMVQDALIRNFAVIGEAVRHVPEDIQESYPEVPWSRIKGIRNVLVHEYFGVDVGIVWDTIQEDLPELTEKLKQMLDNEI